MAGTSGGTRRRRQVEIVALEQASLRTVEGFARLPRRQRRAIVERLHARTGRDAIRQVAP